MSSIKEMNRGVELENFKNLENLDVSRRFLDDDFREEYNNYSLNSF